MTQSLNAEHAPSSDEREMVRFPSGATTCAAWHYPGTNGVCVIMAGGFAVTMGPGTDRFAKRFNAGGHIFNVAARNPQLAAAIAQTPDADGRAATRSAARHQKPGALLRFKTRAVADAIGSVFGRQPRLVPLDGEPGTVAVLTTPDAIGGGRWLDPDNRYPEWQQAVAARSALRLGFYQPGRAASRVTCPLLVVVCDQDQSALAEPAVRAAGRVPSAELVRMPGGHYAPFLDGHETAVAAELSFLDRHCGPKGSS